MADETTAAPAEGNDGTTPVSVTPDQLNALRESLEAERKKRQADRAQLDSERNARLEAENRARSSETDALSTREQAIANGLAQSSSEVQYLEQQIVTASTAGEHAKVGRLITEMTKAQTRVSAWEAQKYQLDQYKANLERSVKPSPEYAGDDPRLSNMPAKTRAWVRENPEYLTNETFKRRANAAAELAQAEGHTYESDSFFEFVNDFLKSRNPVKPVEIDHPSRQEDENPSVVEEEVRVPEASRAAPPSRGGATPQKVSKKSDVVKMSPELREFAIETYQALHPGISPDEAVKMYSDALRENIESGKNLSNYWNGRA